MCKSSQYVLRNNSLFFLESLLLHFGILNFLGPVVQSIVSLTSSLGHQLVKYMPTKLSNTLLFLFEKCENLLHCKIFSHFFNKNNSVFVIFTFENLTKR